MLSDTVKRKYIMRNIILLLIIIHYLGNYVFDMFLELTYYIQYYMMFIHLHCILQVR